MEESRREVIEVDGPRRRVALTFISSEDTVDPLQERPTGKEEELKNKTVNLAE